MSIFDRLKKKDDDTFEVDLNSLKSEYEYAVQNGEYDGAWQDWIEQQAQELNERELAILLKKANDIQG